MKEKKKKSDWFDNNNLTDEIIDKVMTYILEEIKIF